jgi:2-polyprenyl-3-methyl-5-hydroxy-6-metoxy-1,4-benzoquinol methylase
MIDIHEYYEQYWDEPDEYNDPTTPQRQSLLKRHLRELPPQSRILDAGCGRGEFCAFFESLGFRAEGIDISKAAIEYARTHHPGMTFHAGEIASFVSQHAGEFDCVCTSEVIEHLFDVKSYLQASHALLRAGGTLIVTTPFHGLIKNVMIDFTNYAGHYDPTGQHIRFFDSKSLRRCLQDSGFVIKTITGYGRPWPFWKSFFVICKRA